MLKNHHSEFYQEFANYLEGRSDPFESNPPLEFSDYVPIEAFRGHDGAREFQGSNIHRQFKSSGTTSSERSLASFSDTGLANYRAASLAAFFAVLRRVGVKNPFSMHGISLIPSVLDWPDSSLAQMIHWISEIVPVTYISEDQEIPPLDEPIWLFGTAFHHILRHDRHKFLNQLHPDSIVFETGGTKGKTRFVSREELYELCRRHYGCKIVSEYGMCELASQAYDWGEGYRFPRWVSFGVIKGHKDFSALGDGLLLLKDNARSDFTLPIRTEDLVNIQPNGTFNLLGRAPLAPLKGCSLNVDNFEPDPTITNHDSIETIEVPNRTELTRRINFVEKTLNEFLDEPDTLRSLHNELGSLNAAKQSIADLKRSMPSDLNNWLKAVFTCTRGHRHIQRRWFFILPRNHSLVVTYPLIFGYILGLEIKVKIPAELNSKDNFAPRLIRLFRATLTGSDRNIPKTDAILCYGTNETIEKIRAQFAGFVRSFGTHIAVSVINMPLDNHSLLELTKDVMSTSQRGCLAPRLGIINNLQNGSTETIAQKLLEETRIFWGHSASQTNSIGFEREARRLSELGFSIYGGKSTDASLIATKTLPLEQITTETLLSAYSIYPITVPLILTNERNIGHFDRKISNLFTSLQKLSLVKVPKLGSANAPSWDGTHQGIPLFAD